MEYFEERRKELTIFIRFLEDIEQETDYHDEIKILKSQAILMLYNLIEGTVNKGIEYIFNTINDGKLSHDKASQQIRIIWLRYFELHLDDGGQHQDRLSSFDNFIRREININIVKFREVNPSYFKGGSLDSRAITNILKKFSIEFNFTEYKLEEIKKERNFLAHGEKSFTEVGQEKTVLDVKNTAEKVIIFIDFYVHEIETYISNQSYKII